MKWKHGFVTPEQGLSHASWNSLQVVHAAPRTRGTRQILRVPKAYTRALQGRRMASVLNDLREQGNAERPVNEIERDQKPKPRAQLKHWVAL